VSKQQGQRCSIAGVTDGQADHLGRETARHAEPEKILVLGYQQSTIRAGLLPDHRIISSTQAEQPHMAGIGKPIQEQW
jgi:hypothetical protein